MERNYQTTSSLIVDRIELDWRTAFHEAGHAAAIHLGNQQRGLPAVFFEIVVTKPNSIADQFFAKVIEGNLIQNLPIAVVESFSNISGNNQHSCQRAYEADVINLLAGPLAEAKYLALRDNALFDINTIDVDTLHLYGGFTDLKLVEAYLDLFIANKQHRTNIMQSLLAEAYLFVDNYQNWQCIANLANYIINSQAETISCDDAIQVLDQNILA